ncbi:heat shock protein Hsp90 [Panaeolus papilionaceus]|nr:heat shock protein Hsp90 [Panaeolus papilionaceus]
MRLLRPVLVSLFVLSSGAFAEDKASGSKHSYQSDVARLRKIVINSLYSHQEIFLRELISNANDAIEKLRILALTDKSIYDGSQPLNITIKAIKDEDGKGGRLVIADTGIGMSPEELTTNLGTLAKSGTSDFLAKAEGSDKVAQGNLIGAFGLGFYSSFLVADSVEVASVPPATPKNPNPVQHIFSSSADDSTFEVYPDPRGNTIGRGTEITLRLKQDALDYLDEAALSGLVHKHSAFSTTFPIYLFERWNEEVEDEEATAAAAEAAKEKKAAEEDAETKDAEKKPEDDDEAIIEEIVKEEEAKEEAEKEKPAPIMKTVTKEQWTHLNGQPPLWARDPKNITEAEYNLFYKATFKDFEKPPLAWHHFSGDAGDGVAFKGLLFFPSKLSDDFWQKPLDYISKDVKLMVKRVFITSDLGADALPKWASWVKVVIDADDLPLNVSRETLQSNKFLKQLKGIIVKRMIQLFSKITEGEDKAKYEKMHEVYGSVLKLGAAEDTKNRDKLVSLARFTTNQRNDTSLDQYLENRKKGQKQIFYLSEMGKTTEDLAKSVFIEKLHARGYEVLLLNEPLDEILIGYLREWKSVPFQDAARQGLKFGDEERSAEEEKQQQKELEEKFKPLTEWLKKEVGDAVRNVVLSNRLVQSPVAIVAETGGYTANVQKMMSASNAKSHPGGILHEYALKAKVLEINPHSPLIEGLLRRVNDLPTDEDDRDVEAEEELKEVASILIDGALIRSGFDVADTNNFFTRVDRVLRRSLGVSETAQTKVDVKPAPPVASPEDEEEAEADSSAKAEYDEDGKPGIVLPDELKGKLDIQMEEIDDDGNVVVQHDEL